MKKLQFSCLFRSSFTFGISNYQTLDFKCFRINVFNFKVYLKLMVKTNQKFKLLIFEPKFDGILGILLLIFLSEIIINKSQQLTFHIMF